MVKSTAATSPLLDTMIAAARLAGSGIKKAFVERTPILIARKSGPDDLCTSLDVQSQALIKRELYKHYPHIGFVGEEGPINQAQASNTYWLVDPLDGTMNFIHGVPIFGINIALVVDDTVAAAVTFVPIADEMYFAERGFGAFLNGDRINVSTTDRLASSIASVGIPSPGKPDHPQFAAEMAIMTSRIGQIRRLGACAVEMAYVACGRLDAYWEHSVKPWDIAAGSLLVEEAGGFALNTRGDVLDINGGSCLVTTSNLKAELVGLLFQSSNSTN